MKKIIFLLLTSLIWFSCELPDSGRMAVIDFNFKQPDIIKAADTQSVPDRIIPAESKTVVVVMYPSFSDGVIEDNFWSIAEGQLEATILNKAGTRVKYMNFGTDFSGGSLNNIEPGEYSFVVFTFNTIISDKEGLTSNMSNAMTWRIKKNVNIVPGMNLVDLPLKLNLDSFYSIQNADFMSAPNATVTATNISDTIFISLNGLNPGEYQIGFNPMDLSPGDTALVSLYSEEGYLLGATASSTKITFTSQGTSSLFYVSARKISDFSGNPLRMTCTSLLLSLYSGGV